MNFFSLIVFKLILISIINCENVFDVTKFGADLKGVTKSTEAVKKAIDEAVSKGGGTVFFPAGEYLTGPIHLKSNITLHLDDKTVIKFSKDFDDYLPMVLVRDGGIEVMNFSPLIYSYKQNNITIKGKGVLDGQGKYWWDYNQQLIDEYKQTKQKNSKYQKEFFRLNNLTELAKETTDMVGLDFGFFRPNFIQPIDGKHLIIEDVTVQNSPAWNINPVYFEDIIIRGVKVEAPVPSPNTDGIDPDSCKNVLISNVVVDVGDDCIVLKSGKDTQGRRIGRPTENVIIKDSLFLKGHSGVGIGSEMSGGIRNVTVTNCVMNGTNRGLYIKSARGRGGVVENIRYHNISMTKIVKEAIVISLGYNPGSKINDTKHNTTVEPFSERTPVIRNIQYEDIRGDAHQSVGLDGLQESLLDSIKLRNVDIISKSGMTLNFTKNVEINGYQQKISKLLF